MTNMPWLKFYVSDGRGDPRVRSLPRAVRGDWIDLLCQLHEVPRRGYLSFDGVTPMTTEQVARLLGIPVKNAEDSIRTLFKVGLLKMDDSGLLYSNRMVADDAFFED